MLRGASGNTVPGNYHCGLKWTYTVQNATAGINSDCVAAHEATGDVWKCMFAEHSAEHIKHPMFAMQSEYDSWQTGHGRHKRSPVTHAILLQFHSKFDENRANEATNRCTQS